jgi:hypothetical protein
VNIGKTTINHVQNIAKRGPCRDVTTPIFFGKEESVFYEPRQTSLLLQDAVLIVQTPIAMLLRRAVQYT